MPEPYDLRIDLQRRPVGVSPSLARLSWRVSAQQGYEVEVLDAPHGEVVWSSGWVPDPSCTGRVVRDLPLESSTAYWWRVRADSWSAPARFVTTGSAPSSIWAEESRWAVLTCEVRVPAGEVLAAFVEASGSSPVGSRQYVYVLRGNGVEFGRGSVRPLRDEIRYHTHDVTGVLRPGSPLVLEALCWAASDPGFATRLVVQYVDGRRFDHETPHGWRAFSGDAQRPGEDLLEGGWYRAPREHLDAGADLVAVPLVVADGGRWEPATVNVETTVRPVPLSGAGSSWSGDLGQEIVGGLRLDTVGVAGDQVRMVLGEELRDGRVLNPLRTGNVYDETWTLRDGPQRLQHWGYRGFRHLEITARARPSVSAVALAAPVVDDEAHFSCSDPALDRVWNLCRDTLRHTSLDLLQDTPVRERGPYEGDQLVTQLGLYAVSGDGFALARYSGRYLSENPTWPTEFRMLPPVLGWLDFLATGDDGWLHEAYDAWVARDPGEGLVRNPVPGQGPGIPYSDLVDWPVTNRDGFEFRDVNTVVNAFRYAELRALAAIARVLGRDPRGHLRRASQVRCAVNRDLLDPVAYRDGLGSDHHAQHATAYAVALGLAPPNRLPQLGSWLADGGMRTSIYGAQFLLEALYVCGRGDAALRLMTSPDRPGWIDVMDRLGATLTPEAWDPELKPNMTFSHPWGSSPANVIARRLVGVQVVSPGASVVRVRPQPGQLEWFEASVPTIRGPVEVSYRRGEPLRVHVPAGTTLLPTP